MNYLYLDIESIPAQYDAAITRIASTVKAPGNIKKPESIAAWEKESKEGAVQEAIDKTSFDGGLGHVCCIGWAFDDEEVQSESVLDVSEEKRRLETFFRSVSEDVPSYGGAYGSVTVVGHYVSGFDILFLTQRAIVLGVKVPAWWPYEAKPWGNEIFDTMVKWAGPKGTISLDNLCFALGIEGKGDVDGSMVAQMFKDGRHEDIAAYCRQDVERVRKIHKKMMVSIG